MVFEVLSTKSQSQKLIRDDFRVCAVRHNFTQPTVRMELHDPREKMLQSMTRHLWTVYGTKNARIKSSLVQT